VDPRPIHNTPAMPSTIRKNEVAFDGGREFHLGRIPCDSRLAAYSSEKDGRSVKIIIYLVHGGMLGYYQNRPPRATDRAFGRCVARLLFRFGLAFGGVMERVLQRTEFIVVTILGLRASCR
jgi:hypothetical protein